MVYLHCNGNALQSTILYLCVLVRCICIYILYLDLHLHLRLYLQVHLQLNWRHLAYVNCRRLV